MGKVKLTEAHELDIEELAILRAIYSNHVSMRVRACRARNVLRDAGYIAATKSRSWKADGRHTYWHITPAGSAILSEGKAS